MGKQADTMSAGRSLKYLLVFQLKLALDALRDFALSPLSVGAFVLDAVIRPDYEKSLTVRLMLLGRRSDRLINLFGEYSDRGHYTVDHTLDEVEQAMVKRRTSAGPGPVREETRGDG